jgi:hypothetical protein
VSAKGRSKCGPRTNEFVCRPSETALKRVSVFCNRRCEASGGST